MMLFNKTGFDLTTSAISTPPPAMLLGVIDLLAGSLSATRNDGEMLSLFGVIYGFSCEELSICFGAFSQ